MPTFEETIRPYFETGDFPTQAQFYEMFAKLRWKDQAIAISDITNLQDILNGFGSGIEQFAAAGGDFSYEIQPGNLLEKILVLPNATATISAERVSNPGSEDIIYSEEATTTGAVWVVNIWSPTGATPILIKGVPATSKIIFVNRRLI